MNEFTSREHLEAKMPTWQFVLLSWITYYFYYMYWFLQLIRKINKKHENAISEKFFFIWLIIIVLSVLALIPALSLMITMANSMSEVTLYLNMQLTVSTIVTIVGAGGLIYLTLKARNSLEVCFAEAGTPIKIATWLCVVFNFIYLYYVVHNQEAVYAKQSNRPQPVTPPINKKPSLAEELQKLQELKEKGILSEEEFTEQKKKMLG